MKAWLSVPTVRIVLGGFIFVVGMTLWSNIRTFDLTFTKLSTGPGVSAELNEDLPSLEPKNFTLTDSKGRTVSLADFKGKPVILNFWASWCPPCVEEMPSLLKFSEWAAKEAGVVVLAVSVDSSWNDVNRMFKERNFWSGTQLPFTILLNNKSDVAEAWGTTKYPETYFINRAHKVIRKFVGARNWTSQEMMQWVIEKSK